ncbi:MAG TPA: hypothetical protein VK477_10940 [Acidobacteriota bacterium]|nr:hypothetical protein [Acidobacteriota bacterium]
MWKLGSRRKDRNEWLASDRRERRTQLAWALGIVAAVGIGVALLAYALMHA